MSTNAPKILLCIFLFLYLLLIGSVYAETPDTQFTLAADEVVLNTNIEIRKSISIE